jgi:hypothetical protein
MVSLLQDELSKLQSRAAPKAKKNQALRKSALKSRSAEVLRQSAPERENRAQRPLDGADVWAKISMNVAIFDAGSALRRMSAGGGLAVRVGFELTV